MDTPATPIGQVPKVVASVSKEALDASPSLWSIIQEYILEPLDSLTKAVPEIGHLSPIILTFGTLFVALITLNYPLVIFGFSSAEAYLIHDTLSTISTAAVTPFDGLQDKPLKDKCRSFYQGLSPSRFEYFMKRGLVKDFPNTPLYFISFAAAYCIQSMMFFSKECSELGPRYSNRIYLAIIAAAMFVLLYTMYLLVNGCENFFSLTSTALIGAFIGYLICYQNFFLFGKSAVDLLFVPIIGRRSGLDYVCVRTKGV